MRTPAPATDEIRFYRDAKWLVLLELNGSGVYPWHWWAKPLEGHDMLLRVLGFSGRGANGTAAVFQARDILEGHGIMDYQIRHVPVIRRTVPFRWPEPRLGGRILPLAA